jgi:hypothetical protein
MCGLGSSVIKPIPHLQMFLEHCLQKISRSGWPFSAEDFSSLLHQSAKAQIADFRTEKNSEARYSVLDGKSSPHAKKFPQSSSELEQAYKLWVGHQG